MSDQSKIVVGVDGSACSEQALRWALRQAWLTHAALYAVIAWSLPSFYGYVAVTDSIDWAGDARLALEQAVKNTMEPGTAVPLYEQVVQGHPAQVLLDTAHDAELLVVGSRGHGGFTGMLLGSVSQHLVCHARCPVVVVHTAS